MQLQPTTGKCVEATRSLTVASAHWLRVPFACLPDRYALFQAHSFDVDHGLGDAAAALSEPDPDGPVQACIGVADGPLLRPLCRTLGTILQRCSNNPLQQPLRNAALGKQPPAPLLHMDDGQL